MKVTYDMHRSLHPSLKSETEFDYSAVVETREKKGFSILFFLIAESCYVYVYWVVKLSMMYFIVGLSATVAWTYVNIAMPLHVWLFHLCNGIQDVNNLSSFCNIYVWNWVDHATLWLLICTFLLFIAFTVFAAFLFCVLLQMLFHSSNEVGFRVKARTLLQSMIQKFVAARMLGKWWKM